MKMMMGTALSLAVLVGLGACTETQFSDTLGVGKTSPDENSVRVNQALSMPPDLQLKQPTGQITEYGTPNQAKQVTTKTSRGFGRPSGRRGDGNRRTGHDRLDRPGRCGPQTREDG